MTVNVLDPEAEEKLMWDKGGIRKLWSDISSRDDWFHKDSKKFFKEMALSLTLQKLKNFQKIRIC